MQTSVWAKIAGWAQFALQTIASIGQNGGAPHGVWGWVSLLGSLAAAIGIHGASNTAGSNTPVSGPSR